MAYKYKKPKKKKLVIQTDNKKIDYKLNVDGYEVMYV